MMNLNRRIYETPEDYWRIREFLRKVFLLNERRELDWQVYRFDYWRWHGIENLGDGRLEEDVFLWEAPDGEIAAVLNREGRGEAFLQVHPRLRTPGLEEEMIAAAEAHLSIPGKGGRRLSIWAHAHDELRREILKRRGYIAGTHPEYRRRSLSDPIPDTPAAEGYTIRSLGGVEELPARSMVSWKAFHPDAPADPDQDWTWYRNIQRAPLYRRDLDIVAVGPDGDLASFCTVWFDDVTRTGAFEPVGTAPAHQRRGLGSAVMVEGMRRLKLVGADMATVGSYNEAAHGLYASLGFTDYILMEPWEKAL
ncbi:MAG: GNAT family N-acetyltransferase [Anaerolineales bacterium]|nr:GNAT family N-acetyltransferase [Anaerolineales bacterium]